LFIKNVNVEDVIALLLEKVGRLGILLTIGIL